MAGRRMPCQGSAAVQRLESQYAQEIAAFARPAEPRTRPGPARCPHDAPQVSVPSELRDALSHTPGVALVDEKPTYPVVDGLGDARVIGRDDREAASHGFE